MMKIDITYDGTLSNFAAAINDRIAEAIRAGAEAVMEEAKNVCPVDTGNLRGSIGAVHHGLSAEISAGADYASYVEFGTSTMAAQPYLVPSLLGRENEIISNIAAAIAE